MHLEDVIVEPILSEKSWWAQDEREYTFQVHPEANKVQIRQAIESLFNVKVADVRTMNLYGKPRRMQMFQEGRRSDWKKAIVKLAPGNRIDLQQ